MSVKRVPTSPAATKLAAILEAVESIRPLPASVTRVLNALEEPSTTGIVLAEVIGHDAALAAQVLQLANSALLGYGPACSTLSEAVMRIGFERVRMLVMAAGASGALSRRLVGYRLGDDYLWRHSVAVARAAQLLARAVRYPGHEEAYVAGLLHDMGKLVLDQHMRADYQKVAELVLQGRGMPWQVEEFLFGACHGGVGGMMAERWHFPVTLTDAIRFHHAPSLARTRQELAALVNLADAIVPGRRSFGPETIERLIHPESPQLLGLNDADMARLQEAVHAQEEHPERVAP